MFPGDPIRHRQVPLAVPHGAAALPRRLGRVARRRLPAVAAAARARAHLLTRALPARRLHLARVTRVYGVSYKYRGTSRDSDSDVISDGEGGCVCARLLTRALRPPRIHLD